MTMTLYGALACSLLLMDMQLVLGKTDGGIAAERLDTSHDCWQEVETVLLNSSHQYTACMYSSHLIDVQLFMLLSQLKFVF